MTLQGSGLYFDIDKYLESGTVVPAFEGVEEACGEACFDWYKDWYEAQYDTAIEDINTDETDVICRKYYNLQGIEISGPTRAPYIYKEVKRSGKATKIKVCNMK